MSRILGLFALAAVFANASTINAATRSAPYDSSKVNVTYIRDRIWSGPDSGAVRYNYYIFNATGDSASQLVIGWDYGPGRFELASAPKGWNRGSIPERSIKAPAGWSCDVITTEEDSVICLQCEAKEARHYIPPAGSAGSFGGVQVLLDRPDGAYERSHWSLATTRRIYSGKLKKPTLVFTTTSQKIKPVLPDEENLPRGK